MKEQFENEMKLEFISKPSNEAFARITVAAFASQLDPTIDELADIKTAVSEAVTNCIIHAYENRQGLINILHAVELFKSPDLYASFLLWLLTNLFNAYRVYK